MIEGEPEVALQPAVKKLDSSVTGQQDPGKTGFDVTLDGSDLEPNNGVSCCPPN